MAIEQKIYLPDSKIGAFDHRIDALGQDIYDYLFVLLPELSPDKIKHLQNQLCGRHARNVDQRIAANCLADRLKEFRDMLYLEGG